MHIKKQSGVMLLEALIGVLLFSIGIIAMLGLQASALATANESKYRTEAAFLANDIVAEMNRVIAETRIYNSTSTTMKSFPVTSDTYGYTPSSTNGAGGTITSSTRSASLTSWLNKVQGTLPGTTSYPPTITITTCVKGTTNSKCPTPFDKTGNVAYATIAEITVQWKLPNSNTSRQHKTLAYFMYDSLDS